MNSAVFLSGFATIFFLGFCLADNPTKAPQMCYKCTNCPEDRNTTLKQATKENCAVGIMTCFKYIDTDGKIHQGCPQKDDTCPENLKGKGSGVPACHKCKGSLCNTGLPSVQPVSIILGALVLITAAILRINY